MELRWLNLSEAEGGLHAAAGGLIRVVQSLPGAHEAVLDLLQRLSASLGRDVDEYGLQFEITEMMLSADC